MCARVCVRVCDGGYLKGKQGDEGAWLRFTAFSFGRRRGGGGGGTGQGHLGFIYSRVRKPSENTIEKKREREKERVRERES